MMVNHLPSALRIVTDQPLGVFSGAEGFVFISGLLCGWVYTRKLRSGGPEALHEACRGRAQTIYGWHIGAFLGCLILVQASSQLLGFCSYTSPKLFYTHPVQAALLGSAMLYQPGLLDFLPMYCAFVLALPLVLRALEAGWRWAVLAGSFSLWLAVQFFPSFNGAVLPPINVGSFNLFAWQFLFVSGAVVGNARAGSRAPQTPFNPWVAVPALAVAAAGFGAAHLGWRPAGWSTPFFGIMLNKPALGGLRLADFACVAYLVAVVGGRFPSLLSWRPLALLGRQSLAVVTGQTLLVMALLEFPALFRPGLGNWAATAASIGILFAIAAVREATARAAERPQFAPVRAGQAFPLSLASAHDIRAT